MVNYFTKTLKGGVYVPAEISVCEFSLKNGVSRVYQTLINPGVNIYGHQYEAQQHSESTHNLPLPPNALGEKNLGNIYNDVLNFIRDENSNYYPPVYTHRDCMHIVESVLEFLKADVGANNIDVKVYPIQYLFYIMKEATCETGDQEKPTSIYITDAFFERDSFEFHIGIACQFHEDNDKCKYCTQSYVTRWGYMFADYMCKDIAIQLLPGRHCPTNTNLDGITNRAPSTCNDTESSVSVDTTTSSATKAVASSKVYYDDQKTTISDASRTYTVDFPSLGAHGSRKKAAPSPSPSSQHQNTTCKLNGSDDEYGDLNPWSSRSRNIPRQPETSHFDIDYMKDDDLNSEADDFNSVASFGRGRASLANTTFNNTTLSSHGRGDLFRP